MQGSGRRFCENPVRRRPAGRATRDKKYLRLVEVTAIGPCPTSVTYQVVKDP